MPIKPRQVSNFIDQHRSLQYLAAEIRHQQQLLQLIQQKLPDKLARHCDFVVMQDAQLCITVDSPVWSNQLRFASPDLLSVLRKEFPGIGSIKVRTVPRQAIKTGLRERREVQRACSAGTVQHLRTCAAYTEEEGLKQALEKLTSTIQAKRRSS